MHTKENAPTIPVPTEGADMARPDDRDEAVRLRVEGRLSMGEIQRRVGASKGSLGLWLKPHPLDPAELRERRAAALRATRARTAAPPRAPDRAAAVQRFGSSVDADGMDVLRKGRIAEAAVSLRLAVLGFSVFKSVFDGDRVDIVVGAPDAPRFAAIQVKWVAKGRGTYGRPVVPLVRSVGCRSAGRRKARYAEHDFDFIVGYDFDGDAAYVFSRAEVAGNAACVTVTDPARESWRKVGEHLAWG